MAPNSSEARITTFSPYQAFTRSEWCVLESHPDFPFSSIDIDRLKGLNEPLTKQEISDIYLPMCRLLQIHFKHHQHMHREYQRFFGVPTPHTPFVIGIAGSVAVGKSTAARTLQKLLSMNADTPTVELITTDGFLYPNAELERRGLLDRKGFPESYDARSVLNFLSAVKSGRRHLRAPLYSHLTYDVLRDEYQEIDQPDILIVEGINVLQVDTTNPSVRRRVFVSDFFDFSIYVDADTDSIHRWYVERFLKLQQTAFQDPHSYFRRYADLSPQEAVAIANDIWSRINLVNLEQNILPTRFRSDLIIVKGDDHAIRNIRLRKV